MTSLFISDLHLENARPEIVRAFQRFMVQIAPKADALYILGDFFEVWIGDDDDTPLNRDIIALLKAFTDQGKPLFVMAGNRDFLLGERFAQQAGATLLPDPSVIDLYGTPTLLMHGDSLCTRDLDYMAFRRQARSPEWQQQLLSQPLEARRQFARQVREQSQSMNSLKAEDIMDVTPEAVIETLQDHGVKRLIHGHTHRPDRHPVPMAAEPGERIVLGDWHDQLWWLQAEDDGSLELIHRPIDQPDLHA